MLLEPCELGISMQVHDSAAAFKLVLRVTISGLSVERHFISPFEPVFLELVACEKCQAR